MTCSMAIEFAPFGIRVNAVSPGLTDTQIWQDIQAAAENVDEVRQHWFDNIPLGRVQSAREVGNVVQFLRQKSFGFLGGCEVDLTAAEITKSPAEIETVAVMGAVVITVPDGWEIIGHVIPVMGGFEVNVRPGDGAGKKLIVRGAAIMGGVEIKSAPARKA